MAQEAITRGSYKSALGQVQSRKKMVSGLRGIDKMTKERPGAPSLQSYPYSQQKVAEQACLENQLEH